jgi:hypothetical protein
VGEAWEGEPRGGAIHIHVNRILEGSPTLRVRGKADAAVERNCDRCGTPLRFEHAGTVDLYYVPEGEAWPKGPSSTGTTSTSAGTTARSSTSATSSWRH